MSSSISTDLDLEKHYRVYIDAINALPGSTLDAYLATTIVHNDRSLTKADYHSLIVDGARFTIVGLIVDVQKREVAARLSITWNEGKTNVKEHVFYELNEKWEIEQVWSMVEEV
ncbi:hypothetical protein IAR55_002257 [Kwoniella newhampshirensis]|uniref:Uncharacterized protein n=1 Tax=Kwoniella newhampshirensis TaxID=1651941 RepID=A0AAW0YQL6_9TREE